MSFPDNPFRAIKPAATEEAVPEKEPSIWTTIDVGESFMIENYIYRGQYVAANTYGRRNGKKFKSERVGGGLLVTRIK